jgi:acetyl-CoA carboxylase biotin carboxyl carrier protein
MTIEEIKELLEIFNESGIGEMELQRGENRLRLKRAGMSQEIVMPAPAPVVVTAAPQAPMIAAAHAGETAHPSPMAPPSAKAAEPDASLHYQPSPIVGTYYDAAAPGAPPFVKVGDSVEPGQVLCIIESMKLMNEIESEVAGIIAAKLVENGRPVEYGEALLAIRRR